MQYQGILLAVNLAIIIVAYLALRGKPDKFKLILVTTLFAYFLAGILPYLLAWISSKWIILFYAIAIAVALIVIDFIITDNVIEELENDKIDIIAAESSSLTATAGGGKSSAPISEPLVMAESSKLATRIGSRHVTAEASSHGSAGEYIKVKTSTDVIKNTNTEKIVENETPASMDKEAQKYPEPVINEIYNRNLVHEISDIVEVPAAANNIEEQPPAQRDFILEPSEPSIDTLPAELESVAQALELHPAGSDSETLTAEPMLASGPEIIAIETTESSPEPETEAAELLTDEPDLYMETAEALPVIEEPEAVDIEIIDDTFDESLQALHQEMIHAGQDDLDVGIIDEESLARLDIDDLIDIAFQSKFRDDYRSAIRVFELVLERNPAPRIASLIIDDLEIMQSKIA